MTAWGTARSTLERADPARDRLHDLTQGMTCNEIAAAVDLAEALNLHTLIHGQAGRGDNPMRLAQLEAIYRPICDDWHNLRDIIKAEAGGDPKVWGPVLDRITALSKRLRGLEWVPGVSGMPLGETAH